ncbi:S8 family serine peptidase [Streptomyces sp. NPDC001941]|uniref:S8 family peptidase n=1 Tax=Streptomyces sp. NPDC001941 TaxID=3154659 RepID=UPI0033208E57
MSRLIRNARRHRGGPPRALLAVTAAASVVALVTGTAGPSAAVGSGPSAGAPAPGAEQGRRVALVTGDQVIVGAGDRVVRFEPAKGREHVPVQLQRVGKHTLLVPADAQHLISTGKLDRRLFDLTELTDPRLLRSQRDGRLGLIVRYAGDGTGSAKAALRAAGDTRVQRTLTSLNADVVRTSSDDTARVWEALTDQKQGVRAAASGIAAVWLDGVRQASLDGSTKQIGADKAWASGYDGTGVKIAVLDTGVDASHDDLRTQVVAEKNFSTAADAVDRNGHGTHVASTAAGTGAKSGGKYKGVAPGARILSGKVLDDGGTGSDSAIIAGMEWAAAQGADVVNLSLGSRDTPGVDPMEEAVNRLSAQKGILFAIAAGNSGKGGEGTLGSPGSAEAALTVGAVDKDDQLAYFSSMGPRAGDGGVKPDVTAPGVAITAAAAAGSALDTEPGATHPAPGYLQLDGTSMATPHVAGAAAILKQRHPDWTYAELKGALTASTKGGDGLTAFQQGSGRVQVDKALSQTVIADPVSVAFGTVAWPHTDDRPTSKKIRYRNLGTSDVTLDLAVSGLDPQGAPAPAGFFTLGADRVTVPAGGTAEVSLAADTKLGGETFGTYSAYVTASGGGQSVRTAAAVVREGEAYDLTIRTLDRDGSDAKLFTNSLNGLTGPAEGFRAGVENEPGTHVLRVPRGSYVLNTAVYQDPKDLTKGVDWISQPRLDITGDTVVTPDARSAKPVDITVPGISKSVFAGAYFQRGEDGNSVGNGWVLPGGMTGFRTAHVGPDVTAEPMRQSWDAHFVKDAATQYSVAFGGRTTRLATGYTNHVKAGELATVKIGLGASAPGKTAFTTPFPQLPDLAGIGTGYSAPQAAPGTRTLHLSTADGAQWVREFEQWGTNEGGEHVYEASYTGGAPKAYAAGRTYQEAFNTGVFGPRLGADAGVFRTAPDPDTGEQQIVGALPLFADGQGHDGYAVTSSATSTLYRDGVKVAENHDPLTGQAPFTVDAADALYRLTTTAERPAATAGAATRIDTDFTFRSGQVADTTALPVSTVRFTAPVDLASRAPAGRTAEIPLTVQGSAAGKNLTSLKVSASYDGGKTWQLLKVTNGKVAVKNPAKDKSVALRAEVTDKQGNVSKVTVHDAYYGK